MIIDRSYKMTRAEWKAYEPADDDQIIDLRYRKHLSVAKIGKIMKRRHASINTRLHHPALLARIPDDLKVQATATINAVTKPELATLDKLQLPPPPKVADRRDVVVRSVRTSSFWKERVVNVTLPRLRCLETSEA